MVNELVQFFETILPNPFEKIIVLGALALVWYFIKDFKNKTENSIKEIEPLKYLIEMLRSDMLAMRDTLGTHKETLGKANKGIKGDFLDLRKELMDSTDQLNSLIQEVRYDFLDTQKDTVSVASKLELIIKDLDQKYGQTVKLEDEVKEMAQKFSRTEIAYDWVKKAVEYNKQELEKANSNISAIIKNMESKQ